MIQEEPRRVSPFVIPMLMSNGAAGMLAIDYRFKDPVILLVGLCLGFGWDWGWVGCCYAAGSLT